MQKYAMYDNAESMCCEKAIWTIIMNGALLNITSYMCMYENIQNVVHSSIYCCCILILVGRTVYL